MDLKSRERYHALVCEYKKLCSLEGFTEHTRGQRFNGFLAELLDNYWLRARPNVQGHGEIDVAFQLDGTRFVLEAKWKKDKVNEDPIGKLRTRVTQRLAGTIGVLLSMSGYTQPALDEMIRGQRLEVILLDKSHFEAMLYGFLPPQELLPALLDNAHFLGELLTPIEDLRKETHSHINIEWSWDNSDSAVKTSTGFKASPLFRTDLAGFNHLSEPKSGEFFFTNTDGIVRLEQDSIKPKIHLSVPCNRFSLDGQGIVLDRSECIGYFMDSQWTFTALASPHQMIHADWLFSGGPNQSNGRKPAVVMYMPTQKEILLPPNCTHATATDKGDIVAIRQSLSDPYTSQVLVCSPSGSLLQEIPLPPGTLFHNGYIQAISESIMAIGYNNKIFLVDIHQELVEIPVKSTLQLFPRPMCSSSGVLIFGLIYHLGDDCESSDTRIGFFRLDKSEATV